MRFNRIFWKIFTAIWLVNLLVVVCVVLMVNSDRLRERMQHKHTVQVERLADTIIAHFERGQPLRHGRSPALKKLYQRFKVAPDLQLMITDAQGKAVYEGRKHLKHKKPHHNRVHELALEGVSGGAYTVYYRLPRPPRFIGQALRDVLSAQLLLMLVASAVLSALMSWRITLPLNRLQLFSRSYRPAAAKNTLDKKLLTRGDELGDLARDIARMTAQVDATFNAQEDLLHDVSHELRAPLARLQVGVALAELAAPNSNAITKMHAECERMNALIQKILEYSRLQAATYSGVSTKAMTPINLQPLLAQVADDIKFEFSDRPVELDCADNTALIMGDKSLLQSALENLMRNACKYTPQGTAIRLALVASGSDWVITVRDYGLGVDEDPAGLIKPFYRAGGQMHTGGFGLGLSITARAIENLGGTLALENHSEGGLLATIRLPKA